MSSIDVTKIPAAARDPIPPGSLVVVTGVNGFVGSHVKVTNERAEALLRRLAGRGWISLEESVRDTVKSLA